jgi:hypothetical protein
MRVFKWYSLTINLLAQKNNNNDKKKGFLQSSFNLPLILLLIMRVENSQVN